MTNSLANQEGTTMQDEKMTGMLTEDDFLAHMDVKAETMTDDEWLEHYGKKGMKWGQKMAEASLGVVAKSRNVRKEGNQGKQSKEERNAAIEKARDNIEDGTNFKNYTDAQKAVRKAKGTDGHAAAKAALNAVKDKNTDDYHDSRLAKSGAETTKAVLITVAATVVLAAITKS